MRAPDSETYPTWCFLIRHDTLAALARVPMLSPMASTRPLPRAEWRDYFERFTRAYLNDDQPGAATVEVMSPTLGDQFEVSSARLLGLDYDPKGANFEVLLEGLDHLIFQPKEIWILEGAAGFISTIEVVQEDGTKQIIYVRSSPLVVPRPDISPKSRGGGAAAPSRR
jgi:hypothetical protein